MAFCRGCGREIQVSTQTCPHCGALQEFEKPNTQTNEIPDGVKGWSWGAFLLNGLWAVGNRTWIGLLAFVPYVGFVMAIVLGIKGREWAWKNKRWDSLDHFNRVQKKWSFWGVVIMIIVMVIGIAAAVGGAAYNDYQKRAREVAMEQADAKQMAQERIEYENQQRIEAEQEAEDTEGEEADELQTAALVGDGWEPAFREEILRGCVKASAQDGSSGNIDGCKCLVDKISQVVPQARMEQIDSDPEVRNAIQKVSALCG